MRKGAFSSLLLFVGASSLAHAKQEALQAVTLGNNLFSSELYDIVRKSNSNNNLIVSPVSLTASMAMLHVGARGETAEAIRSTLHFPADDQLSAGYQTLLGQLQSDGNVTLEMVNRIYPEEGYSLNPQFTNTLKNYFGAEPHQLNFNQNVQAAEKINAFVSNATHDKIRDLVKADDLRDRVRLVLINAIYFKGQWKYQFPKDNTTKRDFYLSQANSVKVDMMRLESDMQYGEFPELDAKAISLPYQGDGLSLIILLPNKRTGLTEMEDKLKSVPLNKIIWSMRYRKVGVYLPRFKLESTIDLKDPLTNLGLGEIFNPLRANLSGIPAEQFRDMEKLHVSKVIQKAFIEVNEEGSEAAAATQIITAGYSATSAPLPKIDFIADHPFSFVLVKYLEDRYDIPITLFAGRVTKLG